MNIMFKFTSTEFCLIYIIVSPCFLIALSGRYLFLILLLHNTFSSGSFNQLPSGLTLTIQRYVLEKKNLILSTEFDVLLILKMHQLFLLVQLWLFKISFPSCIIYVTLNFCNNLCTPLTLLHHSIIESSEKRCLWPELVHGNIDDHKWTN